LLIEIIKKKIHEKINIKALKNQSPAINVVIKTNYSLFSGDLKKTSGYMKK
jgi:hypothetical protein